MSIPDAGIDDVKMKSLFPAMTTTHSRTVSNSVAALHTLFMHTALTLCVQMMPSGHRHNIALIMTVS